MSQVEMSEDLSKHGLSKPDVAEELDQVAELEQMAERTLALARVCLQAAEAPGPRRETPCARAARIAAAADGVTSAMRAHNEIKAALRLAQMTSRPFRLSKEAFNLARE